MTTSAAESLSGKSLDALDNVRVLCLGDLMLDSFVYGAVTRISPEAPIPVVHVQDERSMLGGAGNVVRNIRALGAESSLIAVVGDDAVGKQLIRLLGDEPRVESNVVVEKDRVSTHKTRYIAGNQQLLRADREKSAALSISTREQIIAALNEEMPRADVLILSDYGKGAVNPDIVRTAITLAKQHGRKIVVDPKSRDFSLYRGSDLISPNLSELVLAAGRELKEDAAIEEAARELMQAHDITHLLVTRSKDGMSLFSRGESALHIPARAREVFDVSGAGDTTIATLATVWAAGFSLSDAAVIANVAAGIVVGKVGTAVAYRTDIKTAIFTEEQEGGTHKMMPREVASDQVASWRREGKRIGFTNGCFDILHPGHVSLLKEARAQCDRLVVGLNSNSSIKKLKGDTRPINGEIERASVLAALSSVDMIVIFAEDTPMNLIEAFRPDVLIKGADYTRETVVGGQFVENYGGRIHLAKLEDGHSTTALISRLKQ